MAPTPQEYPQSEAPMDPISDDDVVITGVSGLLPNCDNFLEFSERLYKKENMTQKQSGRWTLRHPELVERGGFIRGVNRFDSQFFSVFSSLGHATEPTARLLCEQTYQAIYDAGLGFSDVNGKRIGVYVLATVCDSENVCSAHCCENGLIGSSRAMFANRISYYLNLKGPSVTIDGGSTGAILALEKGYQAMMRGDCDAVIVGAGKLILHPQSVIMYNRTMQMNSDGKTKCYDAAADGQTMSEAISVIFLQRYRDAKRVYGVLKYAMTECGAVYDKQFREPAPIPRDAKMLSNFYRKFYEKAGVSPASVEYVDGYGSAVPEMDKVELQALEEVFCNGRKDPLLVGSVASNIGYTDSSAGSCGIFKILLGYQRGQLAASINCDRPRQDIAALRDGRMRIATEHEPFNCSYAAVTALNLTGVHGHALLHGFRKPKDITKYRTNMPYLVVASGRQESSVKKVLDDIGSRSLDPEEIALIHNIYKDATLKHLARGFGIYSSQDDTTVTHCQREEFSDDAKRPLWFVYSGMGSQWVGMGKHLMEIPVFAESIKRCHKVLEPKGLDLIHIITTDDQTIFDNILHSFVGITAIQIGLTDLLTSIGLVPDNIVGHSLGELGCAYADGCFTLEEAMLLSYQRGDASINTKLEPGAMAAVGVGSKQLAKIIPSEIDIACHNNSTLSTISGPYDKVNDFVKQLTADGVFAKKVESSNIAYHSRYIAHIGPEFLANSLKIVKKPKLRSKRWVSTSVPVERWNEPEALYSSAEYHTNNLLNPVLFEQAFRFIPAHAVLVEIAPHSLLQAVLKRALPACRLAPLTRRGHPNGMLLLLEGIGNLYMAGYNPNIAELYPKVEFPVSTSTRPLSHLVEWMHSEKWKLCRYLNPIRKHCSVYKQIVTVEDDEYQYLRGHNIEGSTVFPYAACLVAAWDTLAMTLNHERRKLSVQFHDVRFHSQAPIRDHELSYLVTTVQRGSGYFEVYDGNLVLLEGTIVASSPKTNGVMDAKNKNVTMSLKKDDIYKLLFERGCDYKAPFRTIHSMDQSMTHSVIEWQDDWITFLDAIFQTLALRNNHDWVSEPTSLNRLVIDVKKNLTERSENKLLEGFHDEVHSRTCCGGVIVEHVAFKQKVPPKSHTVALQSLKFVPFDQKDNRDITTAISNVMQIIAENCSSNKITVFYINVPKMHDYVSIIKKTSQIYPDIDLNVITVKKEEILEYKAMMGKPDAVFMHDLLSDKTMFEVLYHTLPSNTFLISVGLDANNMYPSTIYSKVSSIDSGKTKVELARFKPTPVPSSMTAVTVRNVSDIHQLETTCKNLSSQHKLLVLTPQPPPVGLKEQVKSWRKDSRKNVSMVVFDQKNTQDKDLEHIPDMAFSVLHEGVWGGEYYVPTKLETAPRKSKTVSLTCTRAGDHDSFSWVEGDEPSNRGVGVTVHYAGLVGSDAYRAQGEGFGTTEGGFGMDFSGVTASGERVMGLMARGSAASKVRVDPRMLWPVPAHWTMEDAATVPFAYCYALYILSRICNPERGMSILVHCGSGALGQALISVSLAYGLEVFATVSDVHKKHFLRKLFPELKDDHIGNSRDFSFRDMVRRGRPATRGADIVVSCAKGPLKDVAIGSVGLFGHFIDTSQLVSGENFVLGMMTFVGSRTYRTLDFSGKINEDNDIELRWMQLMLSEGIKAGYVKPLSRVTYAPHETARAFRLLGAGRHRGRVLLSLQTVPDQLLPRISCKSASSYVVVCKDEDFGVQFADLLVRRGAKKLHLQAKHSCYLKYKTQLWKEQGVHVEVSSANLSKKVEAVSLLLQAGSLGTVDGVYVVATSPKQKADGAAILSNLDAASRKVCPNLRQFAVVSEDDLPWREVVNERASNGLPALSIKLPKLDRFDPSDIVTEARSPSVPSHVAIEAVERALLSSDHVLSAYAQPIAPGGILEEVAKIPGVNITNATVDRTQLQQVGVDEGRARELCRSLRARCGVGVAPARAPSMTIGQLKRLKKEPLDVGQDAPGFRGCFTAVDEDVMRATTEVVVMQTLALRSKLRTDELDMPPDTLCIVPGVEGHHGRFRALCERLKLPAVVFQHGHDHLEDSVQEAAQRISNSIMKYVKPKQKFYLLGYEYGVVLAMEVAAILENYGMTGTIYLLGGTPDDIRASFNDLWRDADEDTTQNALLHHIYNVICRSNCPKLDDLLSKCKNWPEKVQKLVKVLQEKVSLSIEYLTGIVNGIYTRVKLVQTYEFHPTKLRSKIVLLQAKPFTATVQSLQDFTNEVPVVKNLKATLGFAHLDLSCSNIINSYLDEKILTIYKASSHCNTVLVNEYVFIKSSLTDFD